MRKLLLFLSFTGFFFISPNVNSIEVHDTFANNGKQRNIRVNGTISRYGGNCYIFHDTCSGVNYILENNASAYANGNTYCAVLRFVSPKNCGVSGEARIMSIRPGNCRGGGTFCR